MKGACVCEPECAGKDCGSDGCQGSCGVCPENHFCTAEGSCLCIPQCAGVDCGDDGCGGTCGTCPGDQDECQNGECVCLPACAGKECGVDGCLGSCGGCAGDQDECLEGLCKCLPAQARIAGLTVAAESAASASESRMSVSPATASASQSVREWSAETTAVGKPAACAPALRTSALKDSASASPTARRRSAGVTVVRGIAVSVRRSTCAPRTGPVFVFPNVLGLIAAMTGAEAAAAIAMKVRCANWASVSIRAGTQCAVWKERTANRVRSTAESVAGMVYVKRTTARPA